MFWRFLSVRMIPEASCGVVKACRGVGEPAPCICSVAKRETGSLRRFLVRKERRSESRERSHWGSRESQKGQLRVNAGAADRDKWRLRTVHL